MFGCCFRWLKTGLERGQNGWAAINKKLVYRTKQFSRKLSSNCIHLKNLSSTSNEAILVITEKSDDPAEASIKLKKPFLIPIMKGHYLDLPAFPFNFDKDHLIFQ